MREQEDTAESLTKKIKGGNRKQATKVAATTRDSSLFIKPNHAILVVFLYLCSIVIYFHMIPKSQKEQQEYTGC